MVGYRGIYLPIVLLVLTLPLFAATVSTNQSDYSPGSTVVIAGTGFQAGETVSLRIDEVPDIDADSPHIWTVVADGAGGFTDSTFTIDAADDGVTFTLTATGTSSSLTATTTFTDGAVQAAPVASFQSNCTTASSTFKSGDTVCAKAGPITVQGSGNGIYHLQWIDPTGAVVRDVVYSDPNGSSETDTLVVTTPGTWTLQTCKGAGQPTSCAGSGNFLSSTRFTVGGGTVLVAYASNLLAGDSYVNITNAGTRGGYDVSQVGYSPAGGVCANVYVFDPSEEMVACCSCYVSPDGLRSLSAQNDLIVKTLTPAKPNGIVIKIVGSIPTGTGGTTCDATTPTATTLATGLRAWFATLHSNTTTSALTLTENPFTQPALSASELEKLTTFCGFIKATGSTFGICNVCRVGGSLGGAVR